MWRSIMTIVVGSLMSCVSALAEEATTTTTTTVEKHIIVTPPPQSQTCSVIPAHWEGAVWIDAQNYCTYQNRSEGVAWVKDYWACSSATDTGECKAWEFKPGHWVQTLPGATGP